MEQLAAIRNQVIGEGMAIDTVFGKKPLVYADYTASGRGLNVIEAFIRQKVLPFYANTHSESSLTGRQISALREQARQTILKAVNAGPQQRLIFCGSGATAAINRLIDVLNLRLPRDLDQRHRLGEQIAENQRPVVFIGPYEHHSNELPWRESLCTVVKIPLAADGNIDQAVLERELQAFSHRPLRLGSFSAASNVTGVKSDIRGISSLLHRHGAFALWDYAAAAPYTGIDMQADDLDAVFVSPHKFIGGPGTPGILIVNEKLLNNAVPAVPGGGTVSWVGPDHHRYISDHQRREEGGTPAIIESIRAGLVFKLQADVGVDRIAKREQELLDRAQKRWEACDNIKVLGPKHAERLSIVSLQVLGDCGKPLHYGFVVALLNDLFGIQVRGGCSCAGPYGHALLELSPAQSAALEQRVLAGDAVLRPGWVRLNFNYFIDEDSFNYLVEALALVAELGSRMLPQYRYYRTRNIWVHVSGSTALPLSLDDFSLELCEHDEETERWDYSELLSQARDILRQAGGREHSNREFSGQHWEPCVEAQRWFAS